MARAVVVGLALNALFMGWSTDDVAALVYLVWLVRETREAFEKAREGDDNPLASSNERACQ